MSGERSGCTRGKHIQCLDDAVLAMNQKNGFAAVAGRGLGHSSKCRSRSSLPTAAGSSASQLACHAVQCSGTLILGLNLSLPSLHQSHKKATLIFNFTSVQAQFPLPSQASNNNISCLCLCCATGGFAQCLQIRAISQLPWLDPGLCYGKRAGRGYTVGGKCWTGKSSVFWTVEGGNSSVPE